MRSRVSRVLANLTQRRSYVKTLPLIAGLTHKEMGVSFSEALELLAHVPPSQIEEFERELLVEEGKRVVHSTEEVSVIETTSDDSIHRSLHFNERPHLVQSCVRVDSRTGHIDHTRPPPSEGRLATHLQGLSLALALHSPNSGKKTVCVLGAGGCSLPAYLFGAVPEVKTMHAVELSKDVSYAARHYFGIRELEDSSFTLHTECAKSW